MNYLIFPLLFVNAEGLFEKRKLIQRSVRNVEKNIIRGDHNMSEQHTTGQAFQDAYNDFQKEEAMRRGKREPKRYEVTRV